MIIQFTIEYTGWDGRAAAGGGVGLGGAFWRYAFLAHIGLSAASRLTTVLIPICARLIKPLLNIRLVLYS